MLKHSHLALMQDSGTCFRHCCDSNGIYLWGSYTLQFSSHLTCSPLLLIYSWPVWKLSFENFQISSWSLPQKTSQPKWILYFSMYLILPRSLACSCSWVRLTQLLPCALLLPLVGRAVWYIFPRRIYRETKQDCYLSSFQAIASFIL